MWGPDSSLLGLGDPEKGLWVFLSCHPRLSPTSGLSEHGPYAWCLWRGCSEVLTDRRRPLLPGAGLGRGARHGADRLGSLLPLPGLGTRGIWLLTVRQPSFRAGHPVGRAVAACLSPLPSHHPTACPSSKTPLGLCSCLSFPSSSSPAWSSSHLCPLCFLLSSDQRTALHPR